MAEVGESMAILVPATPELFTFYGKRGYRDAFFIKDVTLKSGEIKAGESCGVSKASACDLLRLREAAFGGRGMAAWDERTLDFICRQNAFMNGSVLMLKTASGEGCAVCERISDGIFIKELALSGISYDDALSALTGHFRTPEYRLRLAAFAGPGNMAMKPFGMAYAIDDKGESWLENNKDAYLSLVMD
jgi:hypothetical protein